MLIVDSQVHIWAADTPDRPWPKRGPPSRPAPLGKEELLQQMDAAGVNRAVIVPPSWEGDRNDLGLDAAQTHPDRFALMGRLDPGLPESRRMIKDWRDQQGMLGLRFSFSSGASPVDEPYAWLWKDAEQYNVPIYILVPHREMHLVTDIARRHPRLKLVIDHMGLTGNKKDEEAFRDFDRVLATASMPNVAAKISALPSFSTHRYPYRSLQPYIRKAYDAFGPKRLFWGTDISRSPIPYQQHVTLFTEELPWLSGEDLELVMGRGLCEWLNWRI